MRADPSILLYLRLRDEVLPGVRAVSQGERAEVPKHVVCRAKGCSSRRFTWRVSAKKGDRWVCAAPTCGADWPTKRVQVAMPHGRGESPLESHTMDLRRVERPLEALPLWPRRTLLAHGHVTRLRGVVRRLADPQKRRGSRQALESYQEALGRAKPWERRMVGAAAERLAEDPNLRTAEVVADAFARAFRRAAAPKTAWEVRQALRIARQRYEQESERRG